MSKKDTSNSYFKNTFGKPAGEKPDRESGDSRDKKTFGDKKKDFSKDRKSGAEGRFEQKKYADGPRKPFEKREGDAPRRRFDDNESKPFEKRDRSEGPRKPFEKREGDAPRRRFDNNDSKPFEKRERSEGPRKPFEKREGEAPRRRFDNEEGQERKGVDNPRKNFEQRDGDAPRRSFPKNRDGGDAPRRRFDNNDDKPSERRDRSDAPRKSFDKKDKPFGKRENDAEAPKKSNPSARGTDNQTTITKDNQVHNTKIGAHLKPNKNRLSDNDDDFEDDFVAPEKEPEKMPLNKYIAHCGICSRRDAVEFIKQGKVKVNGELTTEPGLKIADGDAVSVAGKKIVPQKNLTYILLNKPKGFITTTEDEKGRRTIMDLVASADAPRLYPIGRLDRNTTGLIILTNDGELSQKLSHPKYNIKKIYQVTLDKPITKADFEKILAGVTLEDGLAPVDSLAMLEEKNEVGIEIHSGKNRIVRRIFESLGYQVEKLDRVMYAGLTKKNVPRGKWRLLTDREVILLKHFKS